MSRIWQPQPIEVYTSWIQSIRDESSDDLSIWEIDFLESIEGRLAFGSNLTERQANTLESIYTEKTK